MSIEREARLLYDECGLVYATGTNSARELRQEAKKGLGWIWSDHKYDLCKECKPQPFKLEQK